MAATPDVGAIDHRGLIRERLMRLVPPQSMIQLPAVNVRPAPRPLAAPAIAAVDPTTQMLDELRKLGELKAQGVIDDTEFATLKARIITE